MAQKGLRFIIFTPARTGSTTLMRLMNCHPEVRCLFEPFNPTHAVIFAHESQKIAQTQGIEAALEYLGKVCNAIKHVWHVGGWPAVGDAGMNQQLMLARDVPVIFLSRKNGLHRAISNQISDQMKLWLVHGEPQLRQIRNHSFAALDIEKLREEIAGVRAEELRLRELLAQSNKPWREISYEELFAPELEMETRMAAVQSLLSFAGVGPVNDPMRLKAMRNLFDPAKTGFQNAAAYERIPNIAEVEKELGNRETGFVFDRPAAP